MAIENTPSSHGLISETVHTVFNEVASVFGKSDDGSKKTGAMWTASDTVAGFVKAVPLFMGPGRGTTAAAVLNGLDEVHSGDSGSHQAIDFVAGATKGVLNKTLMDHYGTAEMSLLSKGAIIGGGSSLIDASLSRRTWLNQSGQFDIGAGLERTAGQTLMGTGVGMVAFPFGQALGSRITPAAENLFGKTLNRGVVNAMTIGGSFGLTSGVVGESTRQLIAGQFDPLAIVQRGALDGLSTMAAGGVGHRFSASYVPQLDFAPSNPAPIPDATVRPAPPEPARVEQRQAIAPKDTANPRLDVDGRPSDEGYRQRVEREWVSLTPDQLSNSIKLVQRDLSTLQVEPGKSAGQVLQAAFADGIFEYPQRVAIANGLIREHFASLRTAENGIIADQGANWVHTVNEEARVVEYARRVRAEATANKPASEAQAAADAAMPVADTTLALIASGTSDSTKSQAAEFDFLKPDGTTEKVKLPANFHTHPQDAVLALETMRDQLKLSPEEFDLTKNAILAHQVSPAETIMGLLYFLKINGTVSAMEKAQSNGDTSALPQWIQEKMAADPEFPQKMRLALTDNVRTMRDPAKEAESGQISEKPKGAPVIKFIADTRYLLAPPNEVPLGAQTPAVRITTDGKGWELDLNSDQRLLMRMAGDDHWYVPHLPTEQEAANMSPEQRQYFDRLWRISNAVAAGDNGQYGGMEAPYKYIGAMRGPGTPFHDTTAWDSINSLNDSRNDARWVMDPQGRQLMDDTTSKTQSIYDRENGSFRRRADVALIAEFDQSFNGRTAKEVGRTMNELFIWNQLPNSVSGRLSAEQFEPIRNQLLSNQLQGDARAQAVSQLAQQAGVNEANVEDFLTATAARDWLANLAYWGRPITEADYQAGNTPDYLTAIRVKQVAGRAARQEADMDPENASDNFESVRWHQRQGQQQ